MSLSDSEIAELRRVAEMMATPIDFETLIRDGIMRKVGASYEIIDMERLPEHARRKIKNVRGASGGKTLVQFRKHSRKALDAWNKGR